MLKMLILENDHAEQYRKDDKSTRRSPPRIFLVNIRHQRKFHR
jgi:hypothetical protein